MSVPSPLTDSMARAVPPSTPKVISLPTQRRLRILDSVLMVGCELIAIGLDAAAALVESRTPDRAADEHVEAIDRIAARIASDANALGDAVTMQRAVMIRQHCQGYRVEDGREDALIVAAHGLVGRIVGILRALNVKLTKELAKRQGGRR